MQPDHELDEKLMLYKRKVRKDEETVSIKALFTLEIIPMILLLLDYFFWIYGSSAQQFLFVLLVLRAILVVIEYINNFFHFWL